MVPLILMATMASGGHQAPVIVFIESMPFPGGSRTPLANSHEFLSPIPNPYSLIPALRYLCAPISAEWGRAHGSRRVGSEPESRLRALPHRPIRATSCRGRAYAHVGAAGR